jgi:CRP-like cAMP-binding protein
LRLLLRVATLRRSRGEERIICEGTNADSFYIIREGRVAITKRFEDGTNMVIAVHREGDFFGEMALLDEGPLSASAVALESTELLEISRRDFAVLLRRAPLLAFAMMRELSNRLRGTGTLLVSQLEHKNAQLAQAYLDTLNAVVNTLEARDPYTRGHTERVTRLAKALARKMGLSKEDLFTIEIGADPGASLQRQAHSQQHHLSGAGHPLCSASPRALRREGVPRGNRRSTDSPAGADHLGGRRLRCHDQ